MIRNHQFYEAYLNNHFKIKSRTAKYFLNMGNEQLRRALVLMDIPTNEIEFLKTVKIDLVQSFYQSIETLFGFIHSLENIEAQLDLPNYLIKIEIGELHKFIKSFEDFNFALEYLNKDLHTPNNVIPKFQYLFYFASLVISDFPKEYMEKIKSESNINGIALVLSEIAKEFNKEAHNSIKHGLRCLIVSKLNMHFDFPKELEDIKMPNNWKSEDDTLLYYSREKGQNKAVIVLVPFCVEKIIYLEEELSKLLNSLIDNRNIVLNKKEDLEFYFFSSNNLSNNSFLTSSNFKSIRISDSK
ncbi:hypothetical protein [Pseudopedobacter beijingensis]|uniref:Uncharacterized protein n=1 Tax=Pseudopedobacter beijingensis TaxID=1207056 RepID=A0ABW4IAB6_9SPHI